MGAQGPRTASLPLGAGEGAGLGGLMGSGREHSEPGPLLRGAGRISGNNARGKRQSAEKMKRNGPPPCIFFFFLNSAFLNNQTRCFMKGMLSSVMIFASLRNAALILPVFTEARFTAAQRCGNWARGRGGRSSRSHPPSALTPRAAQS